MDKEESKSVKDRVKLIEQEASDLPKDEKNNEDMQPQSSQGDSKAEMTAQNKNGGQSDGRDDSQSDPKVKSTMQDPTRQQSGATAASRSETDNFEDAEYESAESDLDDDQDNKCLGIEPYVVKDKVHQKKIWWKMSGGTSPEELIKNCVVELRKTGRDRESVRLTWQKSKDEENFYQFKLSTKNGKVADRNVKKGAAVQFHNLHLGENYELKITRPGPKKKKESTISFKTCPEVPEKIRWESGKLSWSECKGAASYKINIRCDGNDEEIHTKNNYCKWSTKEEDNGKLLEVAVVAVNDEGHESDGNAEFWVGGDDAPRQIVTKQNKKNPCRSIDVTWNSPSDKITAYIVDIFTNDGSHVRKDKTERTSYTFTHLMSGHDYFCKVQAMIGETARRTSVSKSIATRKKNREKLAPIEKIGIVTDFKPVLKYSEDVLCEMSWKVAKLGVEKDNYSLDNVVVKVTELGKSGKVLQTPDVIENNRSTVELGWGMEYSVEVIVKYRDLDYANEQQAVYRTTLRTAFEAVENIDVSSEGNKVLLKWPHAKGSDHYLVQVFDPQSRSYCHSSEMISENRYEFQTTQKCSFGKSYCFEVKSFDVANNSKKGSIEHLIGHNVPLDAQAFADASCRSISISWNTPKEIQPLKYECELYEIGKKEPKEKADPINTRITFSKLKTASSYFVRVLAIYENSRSEWSYTNTCELQQVERKKEDAGTSGKIKDVKKKLFTSDEAIRYELEWKNPKFVKQSENYDLQGMSVMCIEKESHEGESTRECEFLRPNDEGYHWSIELQRGRTYKLTITAKYTDLDNESVVEADYSEEISPDIDGPKCANCSYSGDEMTLSWQKVHGAKSYSIEIVTGEASSGSHKRHSTDALEMKFPIRYVGGYGNVCSFKITAVAFNDKSKSAITMEAETIGGEIVPTQITARTSQGNPRRSIEVNWNKPLLAPVSYDVKLYDATSHRELKRRSPTSNYQMFEDLRSASKFFCTVEANYPDKPSSHCCRSNNVETEKAAAGNINQGWKTNTPNKIWVTMENNATRAKIHLEPANIGDAYKIEEYHILVKSEGWFGTTVLATTVFDHTLKHQAIGPITATVEGLKPNLRYDITVKTKVYAIDKDKFEEGKKSHQFYAKMEEPDLHPVKYNNQEAIFSWEKVHGAIFSLEIIDAYSSKTLEKKEELNGTSVSLPMKGDLRIGRLCKIRLRVKTNTEVEEKNETNWKPWTIGGEEVARNVMATKSCEKPQRCVDIRFMKPGCEEEPEGYIIYALTQRGGKKEMSSTKSAVTFKYLRSGTEYQFEVVTKFRNGRKSSFGSLSDKIITDPVSTLETAPMMNMTNIKGTTMNMKNVKAYTSVAKADSKNHDIIQNYLLQPVHTHDENRDWIKILWSPPIFSNNQDGYKVEWYSIQIIEMGNSKQVYKDEFPFEESLQRYCTQEVALELGKEYQVKIQNSYEDIDRCKTGNLSMVVQNTYRSRPCKPKITKNSHHIETARFDIEWLSSQGADKYRVEILTKLQSGTVISGMTDQTTMVWSHGFVDKCGYGTTYRVRLTAIGEDGKESFDESEWETIGGEDVPKDAHAYKDVENPNTMAIVEWKPPEKVPNSPKYIVQVITDPMPVCIHEYEFTETEGKIIDLKPGSKYKFRVMSVIGNNRSEGCMTNIINTKPAPTQVKGVQVVKKQSTGPLIEWKDESKSTKYRVTVKDQDTTFLLEYCTTENRCLVKGLLPGTTYSITVAGGNEDGYGNDSDQLIVTAERERATNLLLTADTERPNSTLELNFDMPEADDLTFDVILHNKSDKTTIEREDVKPKVRFENLRPNTQYFTTVKTKYKNKVVGSDDSPSTYTAVSGPENIKAAPTERHDISTNLFDIAWDKIPGCESHQVKIGSSNVNNDVSVVTQQCRYQYYCVNPFDGYSFQVRSKNLSGHFGEWSKQYSIIPVPPKPENVTITQTGQNIVATWEGSQRESDIYKLQILKKGQLFGDPIKVENPRYDIEGPDPASDYSFRVCACNKNDHSSESSASHTIHSAPRKGHIISVQRDKNDETATMQITWKKYENCTDEICISSINSTKSESILSFENEDRCQYKCQIPGGTYQVKVRAKYKTSYGEWSDGTKCQMLPEMIHAVRVKIKSTRLHVTWKPATVTPNCYKIKVYRCDSKTGKEVQFRDDFDVNPAGNVAELCIPDIDPGHEYKCVIRAVNDAGEGPIAESYKAYAVWKKPQSFMVGLDKKFPSKRAILNWQKPDGVDSFRLDFYTMTRPVKSKCMETCKYIFEDGVPGGRYDVSLFCGRRGEYDTQSIDQCFTLAPAPPEDIAVTRIPNQTTSVAIHFKYPECKPDKFVVEAVPQNNGDIIESECILNHLVLNGLKNGEMYNIKAKSVLDDVADHPSSDAVSETFQIPPARPAAPLIHYVEGEDKISLTWGEHVPKPDSYVVMCKIEDNEEIYEHISDLEFCTKYPEPGRIFTYQLASVNSGGRSEFSTPVHCQTAPLPPDDVEASPGKLNPESTIIVGFRDEQDPRKTYKIIATPKKLGDKTPFTVITKNLRAILCDLQPGESYNISVTTLLSEEITSQPTSILEPIHTYPDKISEVRSTTENGDILFEWNEPDIVPRHYVIEWKNDDCVLQCEMTRAPRFLIRNAKASQTYMVRVSSENASGRGVTSDWATICTAPLPPTNIKATTSSVGDKRTMFVTYEDERHPSKKYSIKLTSLSARGKEIPSKLTKKLWANFNDLDKGETYSLTVQTAFGGMKSGIATCNEVIHI